MLSTPKFVKFWEELLFQKKKRSSEGSCHILKVPELEKQLHSKPLAWELHVLPSTSMESLRRRSRTVDLSEVPCKSNAAAQREWRWVFNNLGEEAGRLEWSCRILFDIYLLKGERAHWLVQAGFEVIRLRRDSEKNI